MKAAKTGILALFVIGAIWVGTYFTSQNGEIMTIQLFDWISQPYPKWQILVSALVLGAAVTAAFFVIQFIVLETRVVRLRRANQKLERALAAAQASSAGSNGSASLPTSAERGLSAISPVEEDV
jgi:uncharacterized integral membrane protein